MRCNHFSQAITEQVGTQVFRIKLPPNAKRAGMHDGFNANHLRSYSVKRTLLDSVDPSSADQDPETSEELEVEMGRAEQNDAMNPPIHAKELTQVFRTNFLEKCELGERFRMLNHDVDALPCANAHMDPKDDVMLAPFGFRRA